MSVTATAATVPIRLQRTVTAPLAVASGDTSLGGGNLTVALTLDARPVFSLSSASAPEEAFALDPASALSISARVSAPAGIDLPARLGFTQMRVRGTLDDVSPGIRIVFRDPDASGRITQDEFRHTALADLVTATGTGRVRATVTLDSNVIPGDPDATWPIVDDDLADGFQVPVPDLRSLGDFRNMTAADFLSALAALGTSLDAVQAAGIGDLQLPLVRERLSDVVVGTRPDGTPDRFGFTGPLRTFFQRLRAIGGVAPGAGAEDFSFTVNPATITAAGTIQDAAGQLASALGLSMSELGLRYDAARRRLTMNIRIRVAPAEHAAALDLTSAMQQLGVQGAARATVRVRPEVDVVLPLELDLDPATSGRAPDERVLLRTDTAGRPEITAGAPVSADVDVEASVGFLGIRLRDANPSGPVPLLAARDGGPMLRVDLRDADGELSIADVLDALAGRTPARIVDAATSGVFASVPPTRFDVSSRVPVRPRDGHVPAANVTVSWPNVADPSTLSLSPGGDFTSAFLPFAYDTDNPQALFGQILSGLDAFASGLEALPRTAASLGVELPVVGRGFDDFGQQFQRLRELTTALTTDPSPSLQALEADISSRLAAMFPPGSVVDPNFLRTEIQTASPAAPVFHLGFGICSAAGPGCNVVRPLSVPLNLGFGGDAGGIAGTGTVGVNYRAIASLDYGVQLPDVRPGPRIEGSPVPRPFVLDTSRIELAVSVGATSEGIAVSVGPFLRASVGHAGDPATARVAARFALENQSFSTDNDRVYLPDLAEYLGSLVPPGFRPADADRVACPGSAERFDGCAVLPVYVGDRHLGTVVFHAPDISRPDGDPSDGDPAAWSFDGVGELVSAFMSESLDWGLAGHGADLVADLLERLLRGDVYGIRIPVVDDNLQAGADAVGEFRRRVIAPLRDLETEVGSLATAGEIGGRIKAFLFDRLGPARANLLRDRHGDGLNADDVEVLFGCAPSGPSTSPGPPPQGMLFAACDPSVARADIDDAQIRLTLGQDALAGRVPFDVGFPGLRLTTDGDVATSAGWSLDLTFGIDKINGFYLLTRNPRFDADVPELSLFASADMPRDIRGELAFLRVDMTDVHDGAPDLGFRIGADVRGGGGDARLALAELAAGPDPTEAASFAVTLSGGAHLHLDLATSAVVPGVALPAGGLPTLKAAFRLDWDWPEGTAIGALGTSTPRIAFENVRVDLGSFVRGFLGPALDDIQNLSRPIKPVLDLAGSPIPVVADLARLVGERPPTLLDLMRALGEGRADLTLVERVVQLLRFADAVSSPRTLGEVPIGRFDVDAAEARLRGTGDRAGRLVVGTPTNRNLLDDFGADASMQRALDDSRTGGGFTFPAFADTSQLFGLLVGRDVTLVRWDAGPLHAGFAFRRTFPVPVGPVPLAIVVSGAAGIDGHFAIGYDTKGVREFVRAVRDGGGVPRSAASMLSQGVFIDDRNAAGEDVPEMRLRAELAAGVSLDAVIIEAGVEGGVRADIDLNLHEANDPSVPGSGDGKLRLDEILPLLPNPVCLFDITFELNAFLRAFVEVGISPFSYRSDIELAAPELAAADLRPSSCEPPVLAEPDDTDPTTLVLNVGTRASRRHVHESETAERVVVRYLGPGTVSVTAFGVEQRFGGVSRIIADAGDGDDVIAMQPRAALTPDDVPEPFAIPVVLCGGKGADVLLGGAAVDRLYGDGARSGSDCTAAETPSDGDDRLEGGGGDDRLYGQGGNDQIAGGDGADFVDAGSGADIVAGWAGPDTLAGGPGDDRMQGGPEREPAPGEDPALFADHLFGGPGNDVLQGEAGDDELDGEAGDDRVSGQRGADHVRGGPGNDTLLGEDGDDTITGGDDADTVYGGAGRDTIDGEAGNDILYGEDGSDAISGGPDNDALIGGADDTATSGVGDVLKGDDGRDILIGDDGTVTRGARGQTLEVILGEGAGNDMLVGGCDSDQLYGLGGDDTMVGDLCKKGQSPGADVLIGGPGNDVLYGNEEADALRGGDGDDRLEGEAGADRLYGDRGADGVYGGDDSDDARGGIGDDHVEGNNGTDVLHGDAGADELWGNQGMDTIFAGAGDDTARGGEDADVIFGGTGDDTLDGDAGDDRLFGDAGDDHLYGRAGSDCLRGNDGADYLEGGEGDDLVEGDAGEDDLIGGGSDVDASGRGGADGGDYIYGGADADVAAGDNAIVSRKPFSGATATDRLGMSRRYVRLLDTAGGDAARFGGDQVSGGQGPDVLFGQDGDDFLSGGSEDDLMEGNGGRDFAWGDRNMASATSPRLAFGVPPVPEALARCLGAGTDLDGPAGAAGQDDMIGGSSTAGASDAGDVLHGDGGADVQLGDNGRITRTIDAGRYVTDVEANPTTVLRRAERFDTAGPATTFGSDYLDGGDGDDVQYGQDGPDVLVGGAGNDDMYGELGDDSMSGGPGEDAMIGDRGSIVNRRIDGSPGDPAPFTATVTAPSTGPGIRPVDLLPGAARRILDPILGGVYLPRGATTFTYSAFQPGTLDRRIDLLREADGTALEHPGATEGGADTMRGGPGHDTMHGAFGDDIMNGDDDGDVLYGGDGADALWGGRGDPDGSADPGGTNRYVDYLFGGSGAEDVLDYRPRRGVDPDAWMAATNTSDTDPSNDQHNQGVDFQYGGWGHDVLQGAVGGGSVAGDWLVDWVGDHNLYTYCGAAPDGSTHVRAFSDEMRSFLERLAYGTGVGRSLADVQTPGSSAYRELALVYPDGLASNTSASYPAGRDFGSTGC